GGTLPAVLGERSSGDVPYRCFDADNHLREPIDAFPKYMDPAFRDDGWRIERTGSGEVLRVGKEAWDGARFRTAIRPGSFRENLLRLRAGEDIDPFHGDEAPVLPEYSDRDARLARMDDQQLEAALIFPGIAIDGD